MLDGMEAGLDLIIGELERCDNKCVPVPRTKDQLTGHLPWFSPVAEISC